VLLHITVQEQMRQFNRVLLMMEQL